MGSRSPSVDEGEINESRADMTKATRARSDSNGHRVNRRPSYSSDSASSAYSSDRDTRRKRSRSPFRHGDERNNLRTRHEDTRHNDRKTHPRSRDSDRPRDTKGRESHYTSSRASYDTSRNDRNGRDTRKRSRSPYRHAGTKRSRRDSYSRDDDANKRIISEVKPVQSREQISGSVLSTDAPALPTILKSTKATEKRESEQKEAHPDYSARKDAQLSKSLTSRKSSVRFEAQDRPEQAESAVVDNFTSQSNDAETEMERRRKRREAIMAKHRTGAASLMVKATEQAAEQRSQIIGSVNNEDETTSRATSGKLETLHLNSTSLTRPVSPVSSPRSPADVFTPGSPAPLTIHCDEDLANRFETSASTPEGEGPSAADYDPMMDMQEDRKHAAENKQLDLIEHHVGGDSTKKDTGTAPVASTEVDMFAAEAPDDMFAEAAPADDMFAEAAVDDMFAATPVKKVPAGQKSQAGVSQPDTNLTLNDNWDDTEGYYRSTLQEVLDGRYQITANLGKGMFATVIRAKDIQTNREVAIKIVRSNESMHKAGMKEIEILQKLGEADPRDEKHLVRLIRYFEFRGHLCMVFENLSINLREVLKKFGRAVGINLKAVRQYARQMFLGLSLMRKCNILHADLKPDNILVNEERTKLKICDLGSAGDASENEITPYLVSRFYRAPEIILGMRPDFAMDMWSIGCTLYELYTGKIMFAGRNNNQMLKAMMECRGKFSIKMLKKAEYAGAHFEDSGVFRSQEKDKITGKEVIRMLTFNNPTKDLKSRLMVASPKGMSGEELKELNLFVDLLDKCLQLNPERRITPHEALKHPFISRAKV